MRIALCGSLIGLALLLGAPPASADKDIHYGVKLSSGPAYRSFNDTHLSGGTLALGVGGEGRKLGVYFTLSSLLTTTEVGLGAHTLHFGGGPEVLIGRARMGASLQLSALVISRVSGSSGSLVTGGAGASMFVSVDVLKLEGLAVFVSGHLTIDDFGKGNNSRALIMWGPSAQAGLRF